MNYNNNSINIGNGADEQSTNFNLNANNNNNPHSNNNNNNGSSSLADFANLGSSAPLALGSSQKNKSWKGAGVAMAPADPLSGITGPGQQMPFQKQSVTRVKQQGIVMFNGGNGDSGLGGLPTMQQTPLQIGAGYEKPQLMVLPAVLPSMGMMQDFSEFKTEPMIFVPSKCAGSGLQATPAIYNEWTSIVVDETPLQVLRKLESILATYSNDVEYSVDEANFTIQGQVFVRHFAVYFKISVWQEQMQDGQTRFEFRRNKGDSVGFSQFWNDIEHLFYEQFSNAHGAKNDTTPMDDDVDFGGSEDDGMSDLGALPSLDYDFNLDMSDLDNGSSSSSVSATSPSASGSTVLTADDLDSFVQELSDSDPSVVYSIAMLLDAFAAHSQFADSVFQHGAFIKALVQVALIHPDTALTRGALIALESLCMAPSGTDRLMTFGVLERVIPLLQHECDLIRKYAIRLLSKLSSCTSKWQISNPKLKQLARFKLAECQSKFASDSNSHCVKSGFIQMQMFESIRQQIN